MTPRPRKRKNKLLPMNLYANGNSFRYKRPDTGEWHGMGSNKAKAIEAAQILNSRLIKPKSLVDAVLNIKSISIDTVVKNYYSDYVPDRNYAESTLKEMGYRISHIKEYFTIDIRHVNTKLCAEFLDNYSGRSYQQHRQQLIDLFKVAEAKGYIQPGSNPALSTLSKPNQKKTRKRLTIEEFNAIHKIAPQWLKNAMDIGLITLQRRSDIVLMGFDDIREGFLWVDQNKGKRHNNEVTRLKIPLSLSNLKNTLSGCRDSTISPFVIHRKPARRTIRKGFHWTQIKASFLSKEFKKYRDKTELFNELSPEEKPTFHEIRALGGDIYDKQFGKKFTQTLLGHTTEAMTQHYLDGHTEWTEVKI
ncbi:MAG: tyrosine-type recombinase/integrase [Gammaproteobacteria bacterium]|nr:tyrosine-type recombinase/integrase [Gammaproteobacteria bacterium]